MITSPPVQGRPEPPRSHPRFGVYEGVRELHSGAISSMYVARSAAAGGEDVAVKLLHPPPSTTLRRALAIEGFLAAAEAQRLAAAASSAVAPVLETGVVEGGCYLVRPIYRSSMQRVIDGQLLLQLERLHALVRTLLGALEEWERATGHPHGNFKSTNVFFADGFTEGSRWQWVLVDPWYQPGESAQKRHARDMEQLARWIVRWVRGRDGGGWPIEDSPEWKVLGRAAHPWREFCNELLKPATPEALAFEAVRARLNRIPVRPPGRWIAPTAAGMLVVTSAAVGGYARLGDFGRMPNLLRPLAEKVGNVGARVEVVPPEFGELCTDWDRWFAVLVEELKAEPVRRRWQSDPHLSSAVLPLLSKLAELDPRELTGEKQRRFEALRESPPDAARRTVVVEKVLLARSTVAGIGRALETWPGWSQRTALLGEWDAQGWQGAAAVHQLPPPPALSSGALGRAIDEALLNQASLAPVIAVWNSFKTDAAALNATGDPVQVAMPAFFAAELGNPGDAAEFATRLSAAAARLKARADFARGEYARRVDRDRFRTESFVQNFTAPLTAESLAQWERELPDYFRVEGAQDPRQRIAWEALLQGLDTLQRELAAAEKEDPVTAATVQVKSDMVAADARGIRERLSRLRGENVLVKDTARFTEIVRALEQEVNVMLGRAREALDELQPNLEKLKAWMGGRTFANPVFGTAWTERSARLISEAATAETAGNAARFKDLRRAARSLAAYLTGAERAIVDLGNVAVRDPAPVIVTALEQLQTERRDQLSGLVLENTEFRNDAPVREWNVASSEPGMRALFDAHRRWQEQAAGFVVELATLGARLQEGFDWGEGVEADLGALAKREQTARVEAIGGDAAEWIRTARQLGVLSASNDVALIRGAASDPAFSVRLAVWRRLGRQEDWPSGSAELEIEGPLCVDLGQLVTARVAAAARQRELLAELREQTKVRWNRVARRVAADEVQLGAVFSLMPRFEIAPDQFDADVRFNFALHQLKTLPFTKLPTAELRQRRDEFVAEVRRFPWAAERPEVTEFLRQLEACDLAPSLRPLTPRELGPASAGWSGEFSADGRRVTFAWKPEARDAPQYSMDYVLVEPPDGTPFFLGTQVVPVSAFIDLLELHPSGNKVRLPEWIELVSKGDPSERDQRSGPQTWDVRKSGVPRPGRLRDSFLVPSDKWLLNPDSKWPDVIYGEPPSPVRPTAKSPMQNLPPRAAQAFAQHVLGARLPTQDEWEGIVRLHGQDARKGNLRDQTWERQRAHLLKQGGQDEFPWPDVGGFPTQKKARQQAKSVVDTDDKTLWFSPVDEGLEVGGVRHLFGNVAIYLIDEAGSKFFVAGGSAISPPEINPVKTYGVSPNAEGFADVGFRPAFDASPELIQRAKLMRVVRTQQYLKP